jgi:hypothetical protein
MISTGSIMGEQETLDGAIWRIYAKTASEIP